MAIISGTLEGFESTYTSDSNISKPDVLLETIREATITGPSMPTYTYVRYTEHAVAIPKNHSLFQNDFEDYTIDFEEPSSGDTHYEILTLIGPEGRIDGLPIARDMRLMFPDKTVSAPGEEIAGQAYRIYKAAFDREPDHGGLGFWVNQIDRGATLEEVSQLFIDSTEFNLTYGNVTDNEFIDLLYQNVLNRLPDLSGYDFWLDKINQGELDRAGILANFSESEENISNVAPLIEDGIIYDSIVNYNTLLYSSATFENDMLPLNGQGTVSNTWDNIVGQYTLHDMGFTDTDGSETNINHSELLSIVDEFDSSLNISSDGELDLYFYGLGLYEELTAQIISVSNTEIYLYSSELDEYETIDYVQNDTELTLSIEGAGEVLSMGWYLL